jgi:hypothetical protein
MANIPYPNIPYPRLSCWWVLNLFCDKRYQITLKIQDDDIYKMLNLLIDNIFAQCGWRVLQHLICIKIATVRPTRRLVSSLLQSRLVSSLLQSRLNSSCQDEKRHLARSFNLTFRYIDVVLSLNNPRFGDYLRRIYSKIT